MQGLYYSKKFYENHLLPLIEEKIPEILPHIAIGLVGEGSECFGFDDALSQDHDFGISLCLWLPEKEIEHWNCAIQTLLSTLPTTFENFNLRIKAETSSGRCGLQSIEKFYGRYIGFATLPQTWQEWRRIPENYLAIVTNGEIFHDPSKKFTDYRNTLLNFYPEDVRLKKIAARLAIMAQAGQYNLLRSAKRQNNITAMLCIARFSEAAISLAYLLNKKYMPFYKWASSGLVALPILGKESHKMLEELSFCNAHEMQKSIDIIEEHCVLVSKVLASLELSNIDDSWLLAHASMVQAKISVPELRNLPEMAE